MTRRTLRLLLCRSPLRCHFCCSVALRDISDTADQLALKRGVVALHCLLFLPLRTRQSRTPSSFRGHAQLLDASRVRWSRRHPTSPERHVRWSAKRG